MIPQEEILTQKNFTEDNALIAEIIYENIFERDTAGRYRPFEAASYQPPETQEGYAYFFCFALAAKIEEIK